MSESSFSKGSDGFWRFAKYISAALVQWRLTWGTDVPTASQPSGSVYIRAALGSSGIYQNTSASSPGTTWTAITGGGGSYTDEEAQDAVGGMVGNTSTVNLTYADATPALTADVNDGSITLAKMANIATDRLIGRDTAGTGVPEALTVSGGVEFTGSGGIQRSALTGDVTASAGSASTTIANDAVTNAKAANMAESTIKGRAAAAGTGDPTDLTASQVKTILATTLQEAYAAGNSIDATNGTNPLVLMSTDADDRMVRLRRSASDTGGADVYFGDYDPSDTPLVANAGSVFIRSTVQSSPPVYPMVYISRGGGSWFAMDAPHVLRGTQTIYANDIYAGRKIIITNDDDEAPATITPDTGVEFNGGTSNPFTLGPGGIAVLVPYGTNNWHVTVCGNTKEYSFPVSDTSADLTTGDGKVYFRMPCKFYLQSVMATCHPSYVSSSGDVDVAIRKNGTDILTNPLTIDVGDQNSDDSAAPFSFNATSRVYARGDLVQIDVDAAGTGVRGLHVHLIGYAVGS